MCIIGLKALAKQIHVHVVLIHMVLESRVPIPVDPANNRKEHDQNFSNLPLICQVLNHHH